jgi:hypothetical protein
MFLEKSVAQLRKIVLHLKKNSVVLFKKYAVKATPKGGFFNKRAGKKKFQRANFIFPKGGFLNYNGRVFLSMVEEQFIK